MDKVRKREGGPGQPRRQAVRGLDPYLPDPAWRKKYFDYLKTPAWQRRRLMILQRSGGRCERCGAQHASHVHHLNYARLGHENSWDLLAVCKPCHQHLHDGKFHNLLALDASPQGKP